MPGMVAEDLAKNNSFHTSTYSNFTSNFSESQYLVENFAGIPYDVVPGK